MIIHDINRRLLIHLVCNGRHNGKHGTLRSNFYRDYKKNDILSDLRPSYIRVILRRVEYWRMEIAHIYSA